MQAESEKEYELETCFKVNREKHIHRGFFAVCFKLYTESPILLAVLEDNCRAAVSKLPNLGKQKLARFIVTPQGHERGKPFKRRF